MTAKAQRPPRRPRGPFSRPVEVRNVPDDGLDLAVEANAAERAAVAAAVALPGLDALAARFALRRRAGGRVAVTGTVEAAITETCVVTLDPFPAAIRQPVDLLFAPAAADAELPALRESARHRSDDRFEDKRGGRPEAAASVTNNDDQPDPPDPIVDGAIDLGAVAVEFLQLARDPYPRKPDARFADVVAADPVEDVPSPFAALRRLKDGS